MPEIDPTTGQIVGEIEQPQPLVNWFRPLKDDRLEVHLVGHTDDRLRERVKVRASGPQDAVWKVVEWFEDVTGKEVVGEWRRPPRAGKRPLAGQLSITEQLESPRSLYDELSTERPDYPFAE